MSEHERLVIELPTRRATTHLARRLAASCSAGDLVILSGALGAGKTFLVRAWCRALGLPARVPVTSPTFTLVQEHATAPPMAHADLYRLSAPDDVARLGLLALRDEGRLVVVEWGEPFLTVLGGDALLVRLRLAPRQAEIHATGSRSGAQLAELQRALGQPG